MATKKPILKTKPAATNAKRESNGGAVVAVNKTAPKPAAVSQIYEDAVKEILSLSENEAHAKKIDNGPLSEVRGKDVWAVHAQLRATDQATTRTIEIGNGLQSAINGAEQHLTSKIQATTDLVERHGTNLASRIDGTKQHLSSKLENGHAALTEQLTETKGAVQGWITTTRSTLTENLNKTQTTLSKEVQTVLGSVKDGFAKLAQATAGTEENLKSQTNAFSQAVEQLLATLQHQVEKRISEFRDESTRQVDKRFNQVDVAFAAVRADQEVIKALLTDIIKDRMGRPEPKVK